MDVAIIDTPWNGVAESLKIAAMADAYEVNVAPHNFYGHLATHDERALLRGGPERPHHGDRSRPGALVRRSGHRTPEIKDGYLMLPTGPGWGTEVNEAAVRAHPPRKR